jgi:hypothetical protein
MSDAGLLTSLRRANRDTTVQYVLMVIFGSLCILAAFAPFREIIRITTVGTLFGFTAGLWVSHLIQVLRKAIEEQKKDSQAATKA